MGHTGGVSHLQITTGQSDSLLSLLCGATNDSGPRLALIGAQNSDGGSQGCGIFD